MIRHYCGLIGITQHSEAARLAYFGLYAQQHRGQESAGIASHDGTCLYEHKGMGLVPDVFSERQLQSLKGNTAVGHVRYSTMGSSSLRNAQPFVVRFQGAELALAHNGNLVNAHSLRQNLEERGAIFHSTNDSEIFMHLIVRAMRTMSFEDAVRDACAQVRGAYALLIMMGDTIIAVRDPNGIRPLSIASLDDSFVFASETCAFDLMEAQYIRSLDAGEMVVAKGTELRSLPLRDHPLLRSLDSAAAPAQCIFELIYFARPDSVVFGEQVYLCRKRMGWQLAVESAPEVDFVMPFPDSGVYAAVGFAQCAELPYEHAMIRNHYVGRTFIQPTQSMRNFSVRVKINPVRDMIEGKRICIVDDSIVRGTTMITRVKKLREMGAQEVHIRISSPPVRFPCYYGIDFASRGQLVAAKYTVPEIAHMLNVDSLHYLSIEGLLRSVAHSGDYCLACFDGKYAVPCSEADTLCLEGKCGCL